MKEYERLNKLIDEIHSLPEPDYEKDFDINKQNEINENLIKFSRNFELKKRRNALMKRFSAGVVGIAALIIFSIVFIPFGDDTTNVNPPNEQKFEAFFHQKMKEMHEDEENFTYILVHKELNVVHKNDAIAIFREYNRQGEQIFIAYFEKQDNKWKWKQTRGSEWNSFVNWSYMHQEPYIYSGAINDNSIMEVYAGDKQAEMLTVEGDKRFWYAISPVKNVEVMFVKKDGRKEIVQEVNHE